MNLKPWHTVIVLFAAAAAVFGWIRWKCLTDPEINFLPNDAQYHWIIFPAPIDAGAHRIAMLDVTFRRTFSLETKPQTARLLVRAAKRLELKINGEAVEILPIRNWKELSTVDVRNYLRSGENTIEARVFNDDAPPALWLHLDADTSNLRTNGSWQASFAGSAWRSAALAADSKFPRAGNLLAGGETTFAAITKIWPVWLGFAAVAILLFIVASRLTNISGWQTSSVLFAAAAVAWIVLFWHNSSLLPFVTGYDSTDHAAYIKYIQEHVALPLPNQGYEMFQPPLYYAISTTALSIFQLSIADPNAVVLLRALTMAFGIAHFGIVLLCLRLLFPERTGAQLVGFLLAAFLPMQLYLSHYVTNETLAALVVSTSVYLALRILNKPGARVWEYIALGLCIGAAMLTKATSVLLLPAIFGALIIKMLCERVALRKALWKIGATFVAICAACGWYYVWIWRHFGKPIVGNWERALGFNWWQDPGFHTIGQYFRFGRALLDPLFSGYNSFADGIFSTLWGDALGGGLSDMLSRTPWNYDLVAGGYWLALIPTALIAIGAAIAIYRFVRKPSVQWFLLLGFSATVAIALVFMTLKVASYAQVKAFYGLSTLVPLCAFAALAWTKLANAPRLLRSGLAVLFLVWTINSFCSVWVQNSAIQRIYAARRLLRDRQLDRAVDQAEQAVHKDPSNPTAQCFLAAVLDETGGSGQALDHIRRGLEIDNRNGHCQLQMAVDTAKQGDIAQTMNMAQRIVEAEPENSRAYNLWFSCARQLQQPYKSIEIAREALAISPFDADLHYRLGLVAGEIGDFTIAVPQFAYALLLQPGRSEVEEKLQLALDFTARSPSAPQQLDALTSSAPDSPILLNDLAWIFATSANSAVRNGAVSVRFSERACALTKRASPKFLATLGAAYAEVGKFSEAIAVARDAATLARTNGDARTADVAENLLTRFQSNEPYRDEPR